MIVIVKNNFLFNNYKMASFYDTRANELLGAVNDYQNQINTVAQQRLQGAQQYATAQQQVAETETQTKASGMEASISDKLQAHMNHFFDEMGLDFSVPGVGKPVLKFIGPRLKTYGQNLAKRQRARRPTQRADESREGTELETRGTPPEDPIPEDVPTIQETSFGAEGARPVDPSEARARAQPEPDEPVAPEPAAPEAAEPAVPDTVEARPPVEQEATGAGSEQIEADAPRQLQGTDFDMDPDTEAALARGEAVEVDAFDPASRQITRAQPEPEAPKEDFEPEEPPEQPGLAGPGDLGPRPIENPFGNLGEAPPSLAEPTYADLNPFSVSSTKIHGVDYEGPSSNPFSPYYRGDDPLGRIGRMGRGGEPGSTSILDAPPTAQPEAPYVSFQYQAPIQPARPEDLPDVPGIESGEGLIEPAAIRAGQVVPDLAGAGTQEARDTFARALTGRLRGAPKPPTRQAEPEPEAPEPQPRPQPAAPEPEPPAPEPELPAPEIPRVDIPGDALSPLQRAPAFLERSAGDIQGNISGGINDAINAGRSEIQNQISGVTDELSSKISGLTDALSDTAKGLAEKVGSSLADITGGDVLSGLGTVLGFGADILGPILGGVGLFESAKSIAESQNDADNDPYAKVNAMIAQAQGKMKGLEADISSDQFASKIGGTRAPAFGSLAAPTFSTQALAGMSGHF